MQQSFSGGRLGFLCVVAVMAAANAVLAGDDPSKKTAGSDKDYVHNINRRIAEKWKENKLVPSARASDYDFIRRVTLDIVGRIATIDEIHEFFKDPENQRRALLVERLLDSKDYAKNWANLWTVWLLTRGGGLPEHHREMNDWLEQQLAKPSLSYKNLVTELLTATGKTNENGAVNYVLAHLGEPTPPGRMETEGKYNMVPLTSRTTRLFLGVQTQCAQCHPHPFNKELNQTHFWGMNAFFRQVDTPRGRAAAATDRRMMSTVLELVDNTSFNPDARVLYEQRNGVVLPAKAMFLDGTRIGAANMNRRQELAKLVTEDKNFSRAYVNRMWAHFFGRGFTMPVDDFQPENEPSHPELLDELAESFVKSGYDPRHLIRWICTSEAYNLSSVANRSNTKQEAEPFFSRMLLKAMSPEELFDSLLVATRADKFQSKEERTKLREDWLKDLTSSFGDDEGNEVTFNGTVVQALLMMNGKNLNQAIANKNMETGKETGRVAMALAKKSTPKAVIEYLYLAALNRPPSGRESTKLLQIYNAAPMKSDSPSHFWQDLFWALLNSNEFILNH